MAIKHDPSSDPSSLTPELMERLAKLLNEVVPPPPTLRDGNLSIDLPMPKDFEPPFKREPTTHHYVTPKDAAGKRIVSDLSGKKITGVWMDEMKAISEEAWRKYNPDELLEMSRHFKADSEEFKRAYLGEFQEENIATRNTKSSKQQSQQDKPTKEAVEVW